MEEIIAIIMVILSSAVGSVAGFLLKKGKLHFNPFKLIKEKELIGGIILYLFSAAVMIWVLKTLEIIIATMLTSTTYIFSLFLGKYLLKEKITKNKIIGIAAIIIGILLIILPNFLI